MNTPCPREYTYHRTEYDPEIGSHGGSMIYVRRDVPCNKMDINSILQVVAIQVELNRNILLCSLYLTPNNLVLGSDLTDLIHQLLSLFFC